MQTLSQCCYRSSDTNGNRYFAPFETYQMQISSMKRAISKLSNQMTQFIPYKLYANIHFDNVYKCVSSNDSKSIYIFKLAKWKPCGLCSVHARTQWTKDLLIRYCEKCENVYMWIFCWQQIEFCTKISALPISISRIEYDKNLSSDALIVGCEKVSIFNSFCGCQINSKNGKKITPTKRHSNKPLNKHQFTHMLNMLKAHNLCTFISILNCAMLKSGPSSSIKRLINEAYLCDDELIESSALISHLSVLKALMKVSKQKPTSGWFSSFNWNPLPVAFSLFSFLLAHSTSKRVRIMMKNRLEFCHESMCFVRLQNAMAKGVAWLF